jgi:hypothetical protein
MVFFGAFSFYSLRPIFLKAKDLADDFFWSVKLRVTSLTTAYSSVLLSFVLNEALICNLVDFIYFVLICLGEGSVSPSSVLTLELSETSLSSHLSF